VQGARDQIRQGGFSLGGIRPEHLPTGATKGFTKLLFERVQPSAARGGIVGTHAGDLIRRRSSRSRWVAIPMDIGKTIHPHPTLSGPSAWRPSFRCLHRLAALEEEIMHVAAQR
jgi:pyruvate/2-oxoglutarate dehydrogenase complex dihydrolipoamide dehydrogenase (E3) component